MIDQLEAYFQENGWAAPFREDHPAKAAEFFGIDDLRLAIASLSVLKGFEQGIYRHQREGILRYMSGENLAVTTSTASGKTLIFNVCALEELSAHPGARIAAVYSLKALAAEQTARWQHLVKQSGIPVKVGRIDGGVPTQDRQRILKESRILVMTPDIIHAWLFSSINSPVVLEFLRNLTLVIVDEAHMYSGVFGSNSAFLFRRLLHATRKLGGNIRFIGSSATMQDAQADLLRLIGEDLTVIGPALDSSPRAVLVGIPRSATSLYQRIGRIGRRKEGTVVVVNNGSVVSESVFREPERIKHLPLVQSALYLHNHRIQYIHAMCLARQGGEDEAVCDSAGIEEDKFASSIALPADFAALCEAERVGEISTELQSMKAQAGDDPQHTFPLRDLDVQFKVEYRQGPNLHNLGSLSQSQLMRETYPGAVYYYQTRPYRVVRIRKQQRVVEVRPEKRYFTSPLCLPTLILPNLARDNVFQSRRYGELLVIECALQVGEAVVGFKERRGNNEFEVHYPLDPALGLFHDAPKFPRYAFTSGVVFTHPALSREHVKGGTLAEIIDEAFLMSLPFERQDINAGIDKHRATRDEVKEGERFVSVYDQTYGSLRLTSHLMKTDVIREVFAQARDIALNDPNFELNAETVAALEEMAACVCLEPEETGAAQGLPMPDEQFVKVVLPGSIGINVKKDNEEFEVEGVFYSPQIGALAYRGKHAFEKDKAGKETWRYSKTPLLFLSNISHPSMERARLATTTSKPANF